MKLDDEYSLQTQEGIDWEAEFRNRSSRIANDAASMAARRAFAPRRRGAERDFVHPAAPGSLQESHGSSPRT